MEKYSKPILSEIIVEASAQPDDVIQDFKVHRESMNSKGQTHEEANQSSPISDNRNSEKGESSLFLADSIRQDLRENAALDKFESKCCIFRVPKLLREQKENAYTPIVVSIGPYHRIDESLRAMEPYKLTCLESFLKTPSGKKVEGLSLLDVCLEKIMDAESWIRASYADPIGDLSTDQLTRMVLIDSVFIIDFMTTNHRGRAIREPDDEDTILKETSKLISRRVSDKAAFARVRFEEIKRDLLLLENQLPFFIIDQIYSVVYGFGEFKFVSTKFFNMYGRHDFHCDHLLDLVRNKYVRCFKSLPNEQGNLKYIVSPTVTHLHSAGVNLKVAPSGQDPRNRGTYDACFRFFGSQIGLLLYLMVGQFKEVYSCLAKCFFTDDTVENQNNDEVKTKSLLEIHFDKDSGILTIPKLETEDPYQSLFRNMIAFEQCTHLRDKGTYVTDYFYFLDCLINTPKDVQLLSDAGIVDNWLGSKFVCDMFNTISNNARIVPWNYAYSKLSEDLNIHCNSAWNRHKATLRNKYFSHPWSAMSVVYAIALLLLTIGQVILGILAVPGVYKS